MQLQARCASRRLENSWAPESSTFHVDVASALLSLNVRYEAEVRVAGLFILDLLVTLPEEYKEEKFYHSACSAELAGPRSSNHQENTKDNALGYCSGSACCGFIEGYALEQPCAG